LMLPAIMLGSFIGVQLNVSILNLRFHCRWLA
jgi:hypothetical protein